MPLLPDPLEKSFAPETCEAPPPDASGADWLDRAADASHSVTVKTDRAQVASGVDADLSVKVRGIQVFNVLLLPVDVSIDGHRPKRIYFLGAGLKVDPKVLVAAVIALFAGKVLLPLTAGLLALELAKIEKFLKQEALQLAVKIKNALFALGDAPVAGVEEWPIVRSGQADITDIRQLLTPGVVVGATVNLPLGSPLRLRLEHTRVYWLRSDVKRTPWAWLRGPLSTAFPPLAVLDGYRTFRKSVLADVPAGSFELEIPFITPFTRPLNEAWQEELDDVANVASQVFPWLEANVVAGGFFTRDGCANRIDRITGPIVRAALDLLASGKARQRAAMQDLEHNRVVRGMYERAMMRGDESGFMQRRIDELDRKAEELRKVILRP